MDPETLEYCISLREKGYNSSRIYQRLQDINLTDLEIKSLLRESDEIFLDRLKYSRKLEKKKSSRSIFTMLALFLILTLLVAVFLGYIKIGLLILLLIWGSLRKLRFTTREKEYSYWSKQKR